MREAEDARGTMCACAGSRQTRGWGMDATGVSPGITAVALEAAVLSSESAGGVCKSTLGSGVKD